MNVILLGDSIFDNAAYVPGEPDVVRQLRRYLPSGAAATLLACDGAVVAGVEAQIALIPDNATHLVLSAGGNDALGHIDILSARAASMHDALDLLASMRDGFAAEYAALLRSLQARRLPTAVCTIYEGNLPEPQMQRAAATALTFFNDTILRLAFAARLPVIDLRLICNEPRHYANPIEPSAIGGDRIARAIAALVSHEPVEHTLVIAD